MHFKDRNRAARLLAGLLSAVLLTCGTAGTALADTNIVTADVPADTGSAAKDSFYAVSAQSAEQANALLSGKTSSQTDSTIGLGGATITMIRGNATEQQLCIVIRSSDGKTIVVDGGMPNNASYLGNYIKTHGGRVDAWLITHAHQDHIGALLAILKNQKTQKAGTEFSQFAISDIYFSFAPLEFYQAHEETYRMPTVMDAFTTLSQQDPARLHSNSPAGTSFNVGNINVKIMNQPYMTTIDSGNNTSIAYMITINGKRLLILGDMPYEASEILLKMYQPQDLKADIVQIAHHGQHGASLRFYQTVHPACALWPTPESLWAQRTQPFDPNQTTYTIALTRYWMDSIGVQHNYVMADGNWTLS